MNEHRGLDNNVVLPSEIDLKMIEKEDSHDIWGEDNLFNFDIREARTERRHVERILSELRGVGMWRDK